MPRPPQIQDWMFEAVAYMARTGNSLKDAVGYLEVDVTSDECVRILKRESFQRLLWEARHRYFAELARDPNYSKDAALGKLMALAQKLEEEGQNDKAAEVILKIAKIQGWVGPESTVSVFGELSQRDLDAIRDSVTARTTGKSTV